MYVPPAFEATDADEIRRFIDVYDFATLVSAGATVPHVSHLPLWLRPAGDGFGTLVGHVARANPHREAFDGRTPALAIFHGPHAYVSPAWYAKGPAVPTWNYAVVHVHGTPRILSDDGEVAALLDALVERYEAGRRERWRPDLPDDFARAMRGAITAFELPIERVEAKFKLGQNRSPADRAGTLAGLEAEGRPAADALAAFLRARGDGEPPRKG